MTNVVEKKTAARDNCGEDESYRSVNALNQGLALSRSQGILLSVPSAVTYSLAEHHLFSIERIGPLEAKTIHTPELLMSVSGKTMLTTIWVDATFRKAHCYDVTRVADIIPFAGSKLGLKRADCHSLYKELSDLTESKSLTVAKVLQSLAPSTHHQNYKANS